MFALASVQRYAIAAGQPLGMAEPSRTIAMLSTVQEWTTMITPTHGSSKLTSIFDLAF
jgi:hypothetical protein